MGPTSPATVVLRGCDDDDDAAIGEHPGGSQMKKRWQPRHTVLIAALGVLAFVLAPVAVDAATGQLVNIVDGTTSSNVAKVDSSGKLVVGDGSGALDVTGTVTTRSSLPTTSFHALSEFIGTTSLRTLYTPASGRAALVTSVRTDTYGFAGSGNGSVIRFSLTNGTGPVHYIAMVAAARSDSRQHVFDPPINVPAGYRIQVDQYLPSGGNAAYSVVWVDGFTLPASSVPSTPTGGQAGQSAEGAPGPGASGMAH
jgi:hypothetical protein